MTDEGLKTKEYLKAKIQIGNVKGPLSYKQSQTVFHHDDIPEDRRKRHDEIQHWLKSKLLSEERPAWQKSTDAGIPVCERRKMENFANDRSNAYQYNFRGESLDYLRTIEPIDKPTKLHVSTQLEATAMAIREAKSRNRVLTGNLNRTGEMPSHPRLEDAEKWKVSTFVSPAQVEKQLADMTSSSMHWSKKVNSSAQMQKKYIGPLKSVIALQNEIRRQKAEGQFSTDRQVNRPRTEPVDRKKLRNRYALEKINKKSLHQHSGVWEASKVDGKYMWSDTGSNEFHSKGDVVRTVNLDAYNLEGPNFINKKQLKPINGGTGGSHHGKDEMKNPSQIRNKCKRAEVYAKYKQQKKKQKKQLREERTKEVEALGEAAPPKQAPRTIENTRVTEETFVRADDEEVAGDERDDEFASYFSNELKPKIMISTRPKCSRKLFPFIGDLMQMIPNAFYYPRDKHLVGELVKYATNKQFTHLVILTEKEKKCNGLLVSHLPHGPTAFFKLSSFEAGAEIAGHGRPTSHVPEIILNNFGTRLGRRTGRFLGSLFPHQPELEGRQVVTFHNQRDFIFVRHHRYLYNEGAEGKVRAKLQELGPRFTLKLKWLQEGTFDPDGEYEWICKRKTMESNRLKFNL